MILTMKHMEDGVHMAGWTDSEGGKAEERRIREGVRLGGMGKVRGEEEGMRKGKRRDGG